MIFGRPETFAIEVTALGVGPSGKDPISAATWTAMKLTVNGKNLFRNVRRDSALVSESIHWPSVHLARWLVACWNDIFHTPSWPTPETLRNARDVALVLDDELADNYDVDDGFLDSRDKFIQAHSLRSAAAGAAMPDVWLSRDGDVVSVAWSDSLDGDIYFLLSRGEVDVSVLDFAEAVHGFVAWVRDVLVSAKVAEAATDVSAFNGWLEQYSNPTGAHEALLSEIGLTASRLDRVRQLAGAKTAAELLELPLNWFESGTLADIRESPISLAFRCAAPVVTDEDLVKIRATFLMSRRDEASFNKLDEMASLVSIPSATSHDFVLGYRLARGVRVRLKNVSEPLDVAALISTLGVRVSDLSLSDESLDGGCVCDARHGPAIFVNPSSVRARTAWGRRVVLAHELCHLLFDRRHARPLGLLSGPWAPPRVERVANAFAIELLLPLAGIVETVGLAWERTTDEALEVLMQRYNLGLTAVSEHVRNMGNRWNR